MKGWIGFSGSGVHGCASLRVFCTELQRFSASKSVQNTRNGLNRYNMPANRRLNRYEIPAKRLQAGPVWSNSVRYTRNARHGRPWAGNRPPDGRFISIMWQWGVAAADVDVSLPHRGRTPRGRVLRSIGPVHTRRSRADFAQVDATTHRFARSGVPVCVERPKTGNRDVRARIVARKPRSEWFPMGNM
jgi:hypothetical protein